ncbi:MAG TPA: FAD-dependent oxidoreductase [Candidatus Eisenbergiella merdipullorum]|uniref:FAD-dependent oxidoreductase n=1 Tax=Candidatus Eisenbergiella merdipullorum TaxID=2838553 RepID=A0A9D2I2A1_9FIRM|nr:FAD-dependent oxidoreductase [Candidatus Eisenbergiella merdipullorum]
MEKTFDYIIYEGSLAGCLAAVEMSRRGCSVALIERRGFLGSDITATFHEYDGNKDSSHPVVREMLDLCRDEGGHPAEIGDIKRKLLDWVEENNVQVFFFLEPCALFLERTETQETACGVLLGSKWGYFLIRGKCIMDAGQKSVLREMADGKLWEHRSMASAALRYQTKAGEEIPQQGGSLTELVEALETAWPALTMQEKKEAEGILYRTYPQGNASFLEVVFPVGKTEKTGGMFLKGQRAMLIAVKLLQRVFPRADLTAELFCYEPYAGEACRMEACKTVKNLYSIHAGEELVSGLEKIEAWLSDGVTETSFTDVFSEKFFRNGELVLNLTDFEKEDWDDCEVKLPLQKLTMKNSGQLAEMAEAEVIIAGGGTAGVAAAMGAARNGAHTLIAEYHCGFGGTQTYGAITGYYFCHKDGFANQFTKEMEAYGLKNSIAGRMLWYGHAMEQEGIERYNNMTVCDVIKEADAVRGIVVVHEGKWGRLCGDVIVDATGDGDLMEYAGVPCSLGAKDSGNVQDCGLMHYHGGGYNLDAVFQSKYEEVLRAVRMAHHFGGGIDFSPLLTPREGRTFEGEYVISMSDIFLKTRFPDAIAMAYTDNDPHGEMSSLLSYMGMMPFHGDAYAVEVPYRACIPKGISGLLAASKSISGTQDAAAFLRMAGDLQNRGYAIGIAAAMAVSEHCDIRDIRMDTLQGILRHMHILDAEHFKKRESHYDRKDLLEGLKAEDADSMRQVLCLPAKEAVSAVMEEYLKHPDNLPLGLALAWFGEREAVPRLKTVLKDLAEKENIDDYNDKNMIKPGNNLGGIVGKNSDYWRINQLLTVFALLEEEGITESVRTLLEKFTSGGSTMRSDTEYVSRRWDLHKIPHYDRLRTLLLYIRKKPSPKYLTALEGLAEREGLLGFLGNERQNEALQSGQEDRCTGRYYQSAYMELSLGEALYQCGSQLGKEILERGLTDVHYILRRRAYQILNPTTG